MSIKVTDRRMFTEDGQIRPEYAEEVDGASADDGPGEALAAPEPEPQAAEPPESAAPVGAPPAAEQPADRPAPAPAEPSAPPPAGDSEPRHPAAQLLEIVQMLVEPAMLFMGEAPMPDGQTVVDLERARIYIDLLSVLEEKTQGNLSAEEQRVLSDVLYQLRMRYVQKKG